MIRGSLRLQHDASTLDSLILNKDTVEAQIEGRRRNTLCCLSVNLIPFPVTLSRDARKFDNKMQINREQSNLVI